MLLVLVVQFVFINKEYREQVSWENLEKKANMTTHFIKTHAENIREGASKAATETIETIR